jgi:hypothetical protein
VVNLIVDKNENFGIVGNVFGMRVFSVFVALVLFIIGIINFKRVLINKIKVFKKPFNKRFKFEQITYSMYLKKITVFDKNINKEL